MKCRWGSYECILIFSDRLNITTTEQDENWRETVERLTQYSKYIENKSFWEKGVIQIDFEGNEKKEEVMETVYHTINDYFDNKDSRDSCKCVIQWQMLHHPDVSVIMILKLWSSPHHLSSDILHPLSCGLFSNSVLMLIIQNSDTSTEICRNSLDLKFKCLKKNWRH